MQIAVADSPQRAVMLSCKHANRSTVHPCPYCLVKQDATEDGGDLGKHNYDIHKNRRTRKGMDNAWRRLRQLPIGSRAAQDLSTTPGVTAPSAIDLPRPLFDLIRLGQTHEHVPVESLHADSLVSKATGSEVQLVCNMDVIH